MISNKPAPAALGDPMMKAVPAAVGEEGSLMKAAMALVGEDLLRRDNKRKTEAVMAAAVCGEGSTMEVAKKRKDDPAAGEVDDAVKFGGLARAENGKWIMPEQEVQFILNVDPDCFPPAERDSMLVQMEWVRNEYYAHGIVLLDDERAARRAARRKEMEEAFKEGFNEGLAEQGDYEPEPVEEFAEVLAEQGDEDVQPEPVET